MMSESEKEQFQRLEDSYRKLWSEHEELKLRIKSEYAEFKQLCNEVGFEKTVVQDISSAPKTPAAHTESKPIVNQEVKPKLVAKSTEKSSWEQFIGEQLLSKIGIAIVLIGVGIGVKYAIDHNLIGSAGRVFAGYVLSLVLGFFAFRYRAKFPSFSAVLASGAVATTYFITFAAYSYYHLYPLGVTFALLLIIVGIAVYLSLYYNLTIIAHLGLVGAYILPPLVSDGTTHIAYYFAYMLLINGGMLVLSIRKNWPTIHYPIILWTTIIFFYWFSTDYNELNESMLAAVFLLLFFSMIVIGTIGRNVISKEPPSLIQAIQLLALFSCYFSGLGYVFKANSWWYSFLFIVAAAAFCYGLMVYTKAKANEEMSLLLKILTGYCLVSLLTIWCGGYTYLFVLINGALVLSMLTKFKERNDLYAAIIVLLCFASLFILVCSIISNVWLIPFLENQFILTLISMNVLLGLYFIVYRLLMGNAQEKERSFIGYFSFFVCLFSVVFVNDYCYGLIWKTAYAQRDLFASDSDYLMRNLFDSVSLASSASFVIFSLLLLLLFRKKIQKEQVLSNGYQVIGSVTFFVSLIVFSSTLYDVPSLLKYSDFWSGYSLVHGILVVSIVALILMQRREQQVPDWYKALGIIALLWLLSIEMIHWSLYAGFGAGYKIFLTLLWVSFAVAMIVVGIKRRHPLMRITAMVILGISILKLFLYDLTALSTIYKTIVFIAIGGLLLVGAYYYQLLSKQENDNT